MPDCIAFPCQPGVHLCPEGKRLLDALMQAYEIYDQQYCLSGTPPEAEQDYQDKRLAYRTHVTSAPQNCKRSPTISESLDQDYQDSYLTLDSRTHRVTVAGQDVVLTPMQWRLLCCLLSDPGRVFTFHHLWEHGWPGQEPLDTYYDRVKWNITELRKKVGTEVVRCIRGFGYQYQVP